MIYNLTFMLAFLLHTTFVVGSQEKYISTSFAAVIPQNALPLSLIFSSTLGEFCSNLCHHYDHSCAPGFLHSSQGSYPVFK